jgi:serine/threonine-protein phosphatase 2A regulatory subunit B
MSGDGSQLLTGSYHNYFHIYDKNGKNDVCIEASKYAQKTKTKNSITNKMKLGRKKEPKKDDINPDTIEFTKKALHVAWHPRENLIAIGAANNLYLYAAQ